jgi:predicted homoserine dehydrogenase-like protein
VGDFVKARAPEGFYLATAKRQLKPGEYMKAGSYYMVYKKAIDSEIEKEIESKNIHPYYSDPIKSCRTFKNKKKTIVKEGDIVKTVKLKLEAECCFDIPLAGEFAPIEPLGAIK